MKIQAFQHRDIPKIGQSYCGFRHCLKGGLFSLILGISLAPFEVHGSFLDALRNRTQDYIQRITPDKKEDSPAPPNSNAPPSFGGPIPAPGIPGSGIATPSYGGNFPNPGNHGWVPGSMQNPYAVPQATYPVLGPQAAQGMPWNNASGLMVPTTNGIPPVSIHEDFTLGNNGWSGPLTHLIFHGRSVRLLGKFQGNTSSITPLKTFNIQESPTFQFTFVFWTFGNWTDPENFWIHVNNNLNPILRFNPFDSSKCKITDTIQDSGINNFSKRIECTFKGMFTPQKRLIIEGQDFTDPHASSHLQLGFQILNHGFQQRPFPFLQYMSPSSFAIESFTLTGSHNQSPLNPFVSGQTIGMPPLQTAGTPIPASPPTPVPTPTAPTPLITPSAPTPGAPMPLVSAPPPVSPVPPVTGLSAPLPSNNIPHTALVGPVSHATPQGFHPTQLAPIRMPKSPMGISGTKAPQTDHASLQHPQGLVPAPTKESPDADPPQDQNINIILYQATPGQGISPPISIIRNGIAIPVGPFPSSSLASSSSTPPLSSSGVTFAGLGGNATPSAGIFPGTLVPNSLVSPEIYNPFSLPKEGDTTTSAATDEVAQSGRSRCAACKSSTLSAQQKKLCEDTCVLMDRKTVIEMDRENDALRFEITNLKNQLDKAKIAYPPSGFLGSNVQGGSSVKNDLKEALNPSGSSSPSASKPTP